MSSGRLLGVIRLNADTAVPNTKDASAQYTSLLATNATQKAIGLMCAAQIPNSIY